MDRIVKLELPKDCRIIAVSDIHTCRELLEKSLENVDYKPNEDFLVIVGDILEHLEDNIGTLKYVKKLYDESDRVYCLMGNNDTFAPRMAYTYPYKRFEEKFYYTENGSDNCFLQMAKSVGYFKCSEDNWLEIRKAVTAKYGELLEFVRDLPICLETQDHVFVHAGLENRPDWENTDNKYAITAKWFMREKNPTGKWLVVGHYPTYNYSRAMATNLPITDENKKMICIDGGLGIKTACQLNLFIINKKGSEYTHEVYWKTNFPKGKVIKDFNCTLSPQYVDWSNQDIQILWEENGIMKVRDNVKKVSGYIPKSQVYDFDGKFHIYQFLSSFPSVKKGEEVSVCKENAGLDLVITNSGKVGWLPKNIIRTDAKR